jgi:hypothetical protein
MTKMRGHIVPRKSCRLHGDNGCEMQGEAGSQTRAQEKRETERGLRGNEDD